MESNLLDNAMRAVLSGRRIGQAGLFWPLRLPRLPAQRTTLTASALALVLALSACNEQDVALHQSTGPDTQTEEQSAPRSGDDKHAGAGQDGTGARRVEQADVPGLKKQRLRADTELADDDGYQPRQAFPAPETTRIPAQDVVSVLNIAKQEAERSNVPGRRLAEKDARHARASAPGKSRDQALNKSMGKQLAMAEPASLAVAGDLSRAPTEPADRENYHNFDDNPVKVVTEHPVSTFSIDVDTGAYANVRRFINSGRLPPRDAVRVEEMINYFDYAYQAPSERARPFSVTTTLSKAPWHSGRHLLRVGVQGYEIDKAALPSTNLVFLVDVSGSMRSANKLGLLKSGLKLLTRQLRAQDRLSLVVYAGGSGVVLNPTAGDQHVLIEQAIDHLRAGGSTNGAAGIRLAYQMARQVFIAGGINRVLLATDGDFNVGTTGIEALKDLVARERKSGISLTTLGFGTGNYNEAMMEQLADIGNGNYAYLDTLKEANKVLVQQMAGTLATIAKDVKIQIEFNPAEVSEYRLIGYENRVLKREDFSNDKVDAGEIGAGHNVTALYELTLADSDATHMPKMRYSSPVQSGGASAGNGELAHLRIRYKAPQGEQSQLLEWPLQRDTVEQPIAATDPDFRFAAAVAAFGQLLRGGEHLGEFGYQEVLSLAHQGRGADRLGYRGEFSQLVSLAQALDAQASLRTDSLVQTANK